MPESRKSLSVFLDTSVVISAVLSNKGASFEIVRLSKAKNITLHINQFVFDEAVRVITQKLKKKADVLYFILGSLKIIEDSKEEETVKLYDLIEFSDVPVLAGALRIEADYLLTLDNDFFEERVTSFCVNKKLVIMKPGDFLKKISA